MTQTTEQATEAKVIEVEAIEGEAGEAQSKKAKATEGGVGEAQSKKAKADDSIELKVLKDGEKTVIKASKLDAKEHKHLSGRDFTAEEIKNFKAAK